MADAGEYRWMRRSGDEPQPLVQSTWIVVWDDDGGGARDYASTRCASCVRSSDEDKPIVETDCSYSE